MTAVAVDGTPTPAEELSSFQPREKEKCPRCESRDTKFCYYNNYNTAQPRPSCRSCRRYWTLGGSLRNVPIGGSNRGHTTKCLRPDSNPIANPDPNPTPNSTRVTTTTTSCFLPLGVAPFGFDLGLGLNKVGAGPDPSVSITDMGFGLGPSMLLLGESTSGTCPPTTGCFADPAPGEGRGGPTREDLD